MQRESNLYDTLNDSRAWQAIIGVIERGGLLAGCSAGAMIQGDVFAVGKKRVTVWINTHRTEFGPGDVPADVFGR